MKLKSKPKPQVVDEYWLRKRRKPQLLILDLTSIRAIDRRHTSLTAQAQVQKKKKTPASLLDV